MLTVDANVFISASSLADSFHADSDTFLSRVRQIGLELYCPTLLLPETASGIVRPTGNTVAAQMAVISVETFPGMNFVSLTEQRAQAATRIVLTRRLRGADAVYVATAQEFGTTLITWDREMLTRGFFSFPTVLTLTPTEWLAANAIS